MTDNTPVTATAAAARVATFTVPGMRCASCIARIENGLAAVPGVILARVNLTQKRVRVDHLRELAPGEIGEALARLGFEAQPFVAHDAPGTATESRRLVRALAVAGFAAMNVMLLSVAIWSGAQGTTRDLFHWLSALIALPAITYAGRPFFESAWRALKHGRTNMDVPISIGVVLATGMSLYETATHGENAYFDGAVMLLFFLLAGRFLDSVMRARAADGVAALLRETPDTALVLAPDGSSARRPVAELGPGMTILAAAGERIAADGHVLSGRSGIDGALVTGESVPEWVAPGDPVLAGTINLDAPLSIRVTAAGDDTAIAGMARLMEAAAQAKSRYVRVADRAARLYAPAVHTLALASLAGWLAAGATLHDAVMIAIAVLIITCPCALGLAVPVAQVVAAGALMRRGILIKDGSALERLAEADVALLDKTGTLTLGRPAPDDLSVLYPGHAPIALALARASRHPLSVGLAAALEEAGVTAAEVGDLAEVPGCGIEGHFAGRRVRLGRPDWAGIAANGTGMATAFCREGTAPVRIAMADALRADAGAALARLKAQGLAPMIVSGDRYAAVAAIATSLGVTGCADLAPGDKLAMIERLQATGHRVLMVGDGLNDGPALKAAHVSIAPGTASDVGQQAADIVFMGQDLGAVPVAVAAARRTMRIVRQNFALAIAYNVLAVPLAILGMVTPLIAALAMSGSSLIVVGNALRLRRAAR